jgi:threonine dehydratase
LPTHAELRAFPLVGPRPTTLIESVRLSEHLGTEVVLATETFQWTGSFKFRAAYHVATHVTHPAIIAGSSGNFGQAMALACRLTGKRCTIVMPQRSARVKIDAVRGYGATVDLIDTRVMRREARVTELAAENPDAYVASAYDDPLVIAGNASLGYELATSNATVEHPFDAILVPIGGGGLASGVITGLKASGDRTPVWAAEPAAANDFVLSLAAGHIIAQDTEPDTIADGARTRSVGGHNWAILQHGVAGAIPVPEAAIVDAVRLLFGLANLKAEPTGALALAALLAGPERFRHRRVCCVVSGGNVDPALYCELVGAAPR